MANVTLIFILFALFTALRNAATAKTQKKTQVLNGLITAAQAKVTSESVVSGTKSFTSLVAKYSLTRAESGLTIGITNSLSERDLVNPKLYLADGDTVSPPPLKIRAAANPKERFTRMSFFDKKPKGVVCYECPTAGTLFQGSVNPTTRLICLYFDAEKHMYGFTIEPNFSSLKLDSSITEPQYFEGLYEKTKLLSAKEFGEYVGLKDTSFLNVLVIGQMTTGKNGRLFFDIQDLESRYARKREIITLSTLASGVISAVPAVAMVAYNYLKAEQGTVLTLENLSTEKDPFVLEDPIWYRSGANVQDIIPWSLGPAQSNEITILVPLGGGDTLKHSVFLLSFRIKNFRDRVVLAVWWPRKLNPNEKINSYALSLLHPDKTAQEHPQVRQELRNIAAAIKEHPYDEKLANEKLAISAPSIVPNERKLKVPYMLVGRYQHYYYWRFPMKNDMATKKGSLKLVTGMGSGRKNGMVMKIFGTTDTSLTVINLGIPSPQSYVDIPEENPPVEL